MTPNNAAPQALESYATFWEPSAAAPVPAERPAPIPAAAKDAYQEFVNVTEGAPAPARAEHV
jgi:hypothetical protein